MQMNAVHFGAGNIGRGFIGSLLHHSGYHVCFIDINEEVIHKLNEEKSYEVVFIDEQDSKEVIDHVSAIPITNANEIIDSIVKADVITTAVWVKMLREIAEVIAKGLLKRMKTNQKPLNIIACENAMNASSVLKAEVYRYFTDDEKNAMDGVISFPNVAIDRIALNRNCGAITTAYVERFYEMIVNESELAGAEKPFKAVTYVKELSPYIERKLFIVNAAHAITAYLGYIYHYETIQAALKDVFILEIVKQALQEVAALLTAKHGFSQEGQNQYIQKVMQRFSNPLLADQVTRVARNPIQKLGGRERLIGSAKQLSVRRLPVAYLTFGIAAALLYDYEGDEEAVRLQNSIKENGIEKVLEQFCSLSKEYVLIHLIKEKMKYLTAAKSRR